MVALGGGVRRPLAGHCLGGLEVEAVPGVCVSGEERVAVGEACFETRRKSAGGVGRDKASPGPQRQCLLLPGPCPRGPATCLVCSRVRVAAEVLAAASRPAARSTVPGAPGAGQGARGLGAGQPRRAGQLGAGACAGRVPGAGGGSREDGGAGGPGRAEVGGSRFSAASLKITSPDSERSAG